MSLINFLHLAALCIIINGILYWWHVGIGFDCIVLNAQTEFQHPVNSVAEGVWVVQAEAGSEKGSLKE